jgi:UDP-3-O-[3-hydroxymyristoyl] glucosamine N-acyltransferase
MGFEPIKRGVLISDIAARIQGEVIGDLNCKIEGLCSLDEPRPGHLSLFTGDSIKELTELLKKGSIAAVLVKSKLDIEPVLDRVFIKVKNPVESLVRVIELFYSKTNPNPGVSSKAEVHPSAQLGKDISIGAFSVIGENVTIADGTIIHPHVVIYKDVKIGRGVEIHSGATIREGTIVGDGAVIQNGAIIGADGFGYYFDGTKLAPVPQVGIVSLSPGVEVGANTCIDRATLGTTKIGLGTKIDNLVQIGHNVQIGAMSILCGQVGVGGSSKIGNGVTLGGQSGVADHAVLADKTRFAAKAGVIGHYPEVGDYAGMPAIPAGQWRRMTSSLLKLPKLIAKIKNS